MGTTGENPTFLKRPRASHVRVPRSLGSGWLRRRWIAAAVLAALCGSGCCLTEWAHNGFRVGPNYSRPTAPVAERWIDYHDPRVKSQEQDLSAWWRVFNDPTLDRLIETAYQQNLTLRVAGSRILQARAIRGIAAGNLFPQLQEAFGSQTRNKASSETTFGTTEQWFQQWDAGFNASWELDFWGRFRRGIESADAELDAAIEDYDDALVVLLADVATNYVLYRTFEQRLVYARQNVEIQQKTYALAEDKFKAGATTERDAQQAKQVLEQTRASIPPLEVGLRQSANRLCVLLGIPVTDLAAMLGQGQGVPTPREVAVGIPADLLRRRPDIRRAERQVAAQSAKIGIAEADLYPRFSLNGVIGLSAEQFADLGKTPGSLAGSIGPAFRWDILNYGRILNNVRFQDARFQELAFDYQDQVLNAGRETEDAIVAFLRTQEQAKSLDDSVKAAQRTVQIATDQYREGAVDFTPVFLFQDILTEQQDLLAAAQGNIALNLIAIYRALGGGWEMRLSRDGNGHIGGGRNNGHGECIVILETTPVPAAVVPAQHSVSPAAQHAPDSDAATPRAATPRPRSKAIGKPPGDAAGIGGTP